MGHIQYRKTTRAEATPAEWLAVGAQIGELARDLALRNDIVAYVGPGAGGIAPACFTPATAEVEVNVNVAFGSNVTPEDIGDLRVRENQFNWPKATGAIFHEALHARFSLWDFEKTCRDLTPAEFDALILLEEGRIERLGVTTAPENAGFLRACALEIVLADLNESAGESDTRLAARLAALSSARVDAGVLEPVDVDGLQESLVSKLGADAFAKLREIWTAVQSHEFHTDMSAMYDLAREWVRIVEARAEENGEDAGGEEDSGAGAGAGAGAGGPLSDFAKEILEQLEESAENAAIGSYEQLSDQQTKEEWQKIADSKAGKARREKENKSVASDVFGKGTGPMPDTKTRSCLRERRMPTGPERSAAVKVAAMLDKAKYRERDEREIHSILPPGRLRTRAMVQGAALKSKGVMTQTEPWRRTVRKHVDDPTLIIGVMVDISGSMSDAMEPMATTAWVMSEAVRRVQGRAAMIYYGQDVFPTLKPGQHLPQVEVYTAPDGTEKFDRAFKALDGSLSLLSGNGARLLVIVSDGAYTSVEREAARRWLNECDNAGVGVLWLTFDNGHDAHLITRGTSAVMLTGITQPEAVAMEIGTAAARALQAVS